MVVGIKDAARLTGISIIAFCAVLVCTMFLNYNMDIIGIRDEIASEQALQLYSAQVSVSKMVCSLSGGCLLATSVVMLFFYISHYIDTHKKELGILKAMGYSNFRVGMNFTVFGLSVLIGTAAGFGGAFLIMPYFYRVQNKDGLLPDIPVHFHPALVLYMVVLPGLVFAALAVLYACLKLKKPVLALLRDSLNTPAKAPVRRKNADGADTPDGAGQETASAALPEELPFIDELRKNTLGSRKSLVFFIVFASFCFSAMTQMSFSMKDLSSVMMGAMIMLIGVILACTTLFLAVTAVIKGNTKTIAMMRVFGYSRSECAGALLGGYRPWAYIGFAVGTGYQYALLRIAVDIIFGDMEGIPEYKFDVPVMLVSLAFFIVIYEAVMYYYSRRISKVPVKEIMLE